MATATLTEIKNSSILFGRFRHSTKINGLAHSLTAIHGRDASTRKSYEESPEGSIRVSLKPHSGDSQITVMLSGKTVFELI